MGVLDFTGGSREFCAGGSIFGNTIFEASFQSKSFLETTFAFLTAGLVLAFTNGVAEKEKQKYAQPSFSYFNGYICKTICNRKFWRDYWNDLDDCRSGCNVSLCKEDIKICQNGFAYRGLPCEMLAMGFIYMILSIY